MRLLILSQFYAPETAWWRGQALATALAARGHTVTVLTGFPNYPAGEIYAGYRQRLWQRERSDGVEIIRVPLYPDHSRSAVKRALNYLSFALSAMILGPWLCGPADAMYVYCPPVTCGIAAAWIGALRGIPFVYDIQDMWPETVEATGMVSPGAITRMLGLGARWVYQRAAAITVISKGLKANLESKGVAPDRVHTIPNWPDQGLYRPVARDESIAREFGLAGRRNVIFAGNLGPAQDLGTAIAAAARLTDVPDFQLVVIGDGIALADLHRDAERRALTNVRFIARQPAERMSSIFAWADALLVMLKDEPLFSITLPSKMLAYFACGRPIIAALSGDGADIVRETGAGIVCPPGDADALAGAMRRIISMSDEETGRMAASGLRAGREEYSPARQVDRFEALLASVAARRAGVVEGRP